MPGMEISQKSSHTENDQKESKIDENQQKKAKPGPKAKPKVEDRVAYLEDKVEKLDLLLREVTTHTGNTGLLKKYGFKLFKINPKKRVGQ